jgi:hypothetical protein
MSAIGTTTHATPFTYPPQAYLDRRATGNNYLYCASRTSSTEITIWRSTNDGASWSSFSVLTRANLQEFSRLDTSNDNYAYIAYRTNESSQDRIYFRRINLTTFVWSAEVLTGAPANGGVAGAIHQGLDIAVVVHNGVKVAIAAGVTSGANHGVTLYGINITTSGVTTYSNAHLQGTRQWVVTGSGRIGPSIDLEHGGDAHSAAVPHLWVCFGRTGIRLVKLAWSGSAWVGPPTSVSIPLAAAMTAQDSITGRWDGSRFLMCAPEVSPGTDRVVLVERNRANSVTTYRSSPVHPTGVIRNCSLSYNAVNGDTRIYAVGTSTDVLYFVDYVRASDTWTSWATVVATAILTVNNWGVRRGSFGNARHDVYTAHSGSPNTLVHTQQTMSYAPNTPLWVNADGQAANVSAALLLDWTFTDPDPADTQSAYAVSRQIGAGALAYWRASDSTWQATEQKNTSGTTQISPASGWGSGGDAVHTYKAKVWDSADVASGYSAGLAVIPSVIVNPSLSTPVHGGTVNTEKVTVTWTVSEQSAFRVTLDIFGGLLHDSGWVSGTDLSYLVPTVLVNNFMFTIKLQTKNLEGLSSAVQQADFGVNFVGPAAPILTITPQPALGVMRVAIAHPAAGPTTFVAAGTAVTGVNASLTPPLPAGILSGDALLILASIRNSGTGTVNTPATWTPLVAFGNMALLAKEAIPGEVAPLVTFADGVANAETLAQMVAFRGAAAQLSVSATQLNGAAANIAYPALTVAADGQTILLLGWKQDNWTSVDTVATFAEIGEPSSAAGDNAGEVWDYKIQTTAANIGAASFTVTGGTSAISRGVVGAVQVRPAVASVDLYRTEVAAPDFAGVRVAAGLAPGATYDDWQAVSGIAYQYRAVAVGVNGSSSFSAWTV